MRHPCRRRRTPRRKLIARFRQRRMAWLEDRGHDPGNLAMHHRFPRARERAPDVVGPVLEHQRSAVNGRAYRGIYLLSDRFPAGRSAQWRFTQGRAIDWDQVDCCKEEALPFPCFPLFDLSVFSWHLADPCITFLERIRRLHQPPNRPRIRDPLPALPPHRHLCPLRLRQHRLPGHPDWRLVSDRARPWRRCEPVGGFGAHFRRAEYVDQREYCGFVGYGSGGLFYAAEWVVDWVGRGVC